MHARTLGLLLLWSGAARAEQPLQLTVQAKERAFRYQGPSFFAPDPALVATLRNASDRPIVVSLSSGLICAETIKWNGRPVKRQVEPPLDYQIDPCQGLPGLEQTLAPGKTVQFEFTPGFDCLRCPSGEGWLYRCPAPGRYSVRFRYDYGDGKRVPRLSAISNEVTFRLEGR
jgi:hypothetical protein